MGVTCSHAATIGVFEKTPITLDLQPSNNKAVACVTCGKIT